MLSNAKPSQIHVETIHATMKTPLTDVGVEVVKLDAQPQEVVSQGRTGANGIAILEVAPDLWRQRLGVRLTDGAGEVIEISHAQLDGEIAVILKVPPSSHLDSKHLALLADQLVATRRVRADDLANDLASPTADSIVPLLTAGERVNLLSALDRGVQRAGPAERKTALQLLDPEALRLGKVSLVPLDQLPHATPGSVLNDDPHSKPGLGWELFPWALPDDRSYRDYLRSVFVLFAHQQKLGARADPKTFPDVIERQLKRRFYQDFRTTDRTQAPLNQLLIPLVNLILTAPIGPGLGFGIAAATLPAQGTHTNRQQLDTLLGLAPVKVQEFANRYRLPLAESDSATSTPVKLNIYTLSRILSDTAQGPVEPPENLAVPQLPGEEGKPILWIDVVGSAPFFLRYDEWLARQQPFFAENLFALRTQVISLGPAGVWLTDKRKTFLEYHRDAPSTKSIKDYAGSSFASIGEVNRSASFLLAYAAADAKLVELVRAIDKSQFPAASRLADEALQLLVLAQPKPQKGEDWEPDMDVLGRKTPLSLARRRNLKVSNISELTGTRNTSSGFESSGFEQFFELFRPEEFFVDNGNFRMARDQATRLRTYQLGFLIPMLRATIRSGLGDLAGAVETLAHVTGFYIGVGMLGTPAGMVQFRVNLLGLKQPKRVVCSILGVQDTLGDRPYTARLVYDDQRGLDGPFSLTPQMDEGGNDILKPIPPELHELEEQYARIVQADAILAWAEALYRTDDAANLGRARELYKAVVFLHGEDPGTSAYLPVVHVTFSWSSLLENPRVRNQIARARLALHQLEAGLNFYGYNDEAVPTLSYDTLVSAAQRWATGGKSAQIDYLAYLSRVEQLDLDLLAAKAQERKARATVAIAVELVKNAQAGVVVAQKVVADVEKLIAAKQAEIDDAASIFSQFTAYFKGMSSSVSSMVDAGNTASKGYTSLSDSSVGGALGLGPQNTAGAAAGSSGSAGLGSAVGGLGALGGFAAFAVFSTTTMLGMADAATKRDGEMHALKSEALPAAQAGVRVQERNVTIANLQGEIATTDLAYARDLINYENERFLNRDFWDALAGVARRSMHRYLDLAGQAGWFAERALAYRLATPIRVIRIGYFDPRMRDVGGVDRLALDLAELEALRLAAARVTVPVTVTYSLARDLPLAFGQLKAAGTCTFALSDDDLIAAHPGTFAHRIRAVDVIVDAPGTPVPVRGILTNGGFSLLRREQAAPPVPLLRFADAYPISEFRLRSDMALHGMPGEHLLPFEGAGFTTTWTIELPKAANAIGLNRVTDVRIVFDLQAAYEASSALGPATPRPASRAVFVSALALDTTGLRSLRKAADLKSKIQFQLDRLALPVDAVITNLAVVLPGVDGGKFNATLQFGAAATSSFQIVDGLAMSNTGVLSDGDPAKVQALNAAVAGSPARPVTLTITKGADAVRLVAARDAMLWIEYNAP